MRPLVFVLWAAAACAATLEVMPSAVTLDGLNARQQLIAEAATAGQQEDWTRAVAWRSSNAGVAEVSATGEVRPVADGEAVITATAQGITASVPVQVRNARAPFKPGFRQDVLPVLTKAGCNSGACHGALAGKNGFKLTLRGYDPEADYDALTRQAVGRRVSLNDPAQSLMLLKPTMGIPHGGGQRFKVDSPDYRILLAWIASGAPRPAASDPQVTGLEVYPRSARLKPAGEQQVVVTAKYSDGARRDVTRWVKFSSSDEGVATVDDNGRVKMTGNGEAAVTLYYASRVLYTRLSVPFPNQVDAGVYAAFPRNNYIDELVAAKLKSLNIPPSRPATDSEFIRRAFLDAAGILPTAEEVEDFLADKAPDKRRRLIDAITEREEYVDYWAYKWSDLLQVSSRRLRSNAMWAFYGWIRESVRANKPWDRFAGEIFGASGDTLRNGALNYYVLHKNPIDLSENAMLAFAGQRLMCARCHNHPLEKWTQTQYYQLANLFSRIGQKNGAEPGNVIVYAKASGDVNHPRLSRPLPPAPLDAAPMALDSPDDRRQYFGRWLTGPKNPFFARSLVNRVWANFMGRGLCDPVDDLRATNPASNEELLAALADDFVAGGYDVRRLIRTIMNSGAYQLSSNPEAGNQNDVKYYSHYIVRRLPAEVLLDAISQVTGVPSRFPGYPADARALELPDVQVQSEFLTAFGRPKRITCEAAERSSEPNVAQALHIINGDTLNKKLSAPEGYPALAVKLGLSDRRILEHLYLAAFSRYPNEGEAQPLVDALKKARGQQADTHRQALEDMMWALVTSKEFLFNQ